MNEAETRAEYIDPALAAAGWNVAKGSRIRREYGITLGRVRDERGLRTFHQFKDNATRGGGTILTDVFRDVVEILTCELSPSKPQAASPDFSTETIKWSSPKAASPLQQWWITRCSIKFTC